MNLFKLSFLILVAITLSACGGGGSSDETPSAQTKNFSVTIDSIGISQISTGAAINADSSGVASGQLSYNF